MVARIYYNLKIIRLLSAFIMEHPELRFCQILSIFKLDSDNFNEEPDKTYERMLKNKI
jgi:hypothetical protein